MSKKFQFSSEEDKKLLECVASYPVLYDTNDKNYKNCVIKDNVWKDISNKVKRTPTDCKKRWRNVKDTYIKIKRGHKYGTGSAAKPKSKWPLLDQLNFLNNVCFERSTYCNMEHTQESTEAMTSIEPTDTPIDTPFIHAPPIDAPPIDTLFTDTIFSDTPFTSTKTNNKSINSICKPTRKSKNDNRILEILETRALERKIMEATMAEGNDPLLTFFKSMGMIVKTFPPNLVAEAKYKVFNIIHELELKSINEKS